MGQGPVLGLFQKSRLELETGGFPRSPTLRGEQLAVDTTLRELRGQRWRGAGGRLCSPQAPTAAPRPPLAAGLGPIFSHHGLVGCPAAPSWPRRTLEEFFTWIGAWFTVRDLACQQPRAPWKPLFPPPAALLLPPHPPQQLVRSSPSPGMLPAPLQQKIFLETPLG